MNRNLFFTLLSLLSINMAFSQTLAEKQKINARAAGYAIIAAKNPGIDFSVLVIPWDKANTLEYNANTQINKTWHPQAAIKGNNFGQQFDGSDFTSYSSVITSQEEFDKYKNTGTQWWIICSNLPSFSNQSSILKFNNNYSNPSSSPNKISLWSGGENNYFGIGVSNRSLDYFSQGQHRFFGGYNGSPGQEVFKILANGNASLQGHFAAKGLISSSIQSNEGGRLSLFNPAKTGDQANNWSIYNMTGHYGNSLQFWNYTPSGRYGAKLIISDAGNMSLPQGKFEAKEVKVTTTPTADFVFEEDYKLPTLEEVERHIKAKKHLPEIASAKEMEKQGVNVGEFQIKLLQKIEELTLYIIKQDKRIKELENNHELKKY